MLCRYETVLGFILSLLMLVHILYNLNIILYNHYNVIICSTFYWCSLDSRKILRLAWFIKVLVGLKSGDCNGHINILVLWLPENPCAVLTKVLGHFPVRNWSSIYSKFWLYCMTGRKIFVILFQHAFTSVTCSKKSAAVAQLQPYLMIETSLFLEQFVLQSPGAFIQKFQTLIH